MSNSVAGTSVRTGFPVLAILGLIFVTLKLCGVIAWSWWWVLAPFWAPWVIAGVILLFIGLVALAVSCLS